METISSKQQRRQQMGQVAGKSSIGYYCNLQVENYIENLNWIKLPAPTTEIIESLLLVLAGSVQLSSADGDAEDCKLKNRQWSGKEIMASGASLSGASNQQILLLGTSRLKMWSEEEHLAPEYGSLLYLHSAANATQPHPHPPGVTVFKATVAR